MFRIYLVTISPFLFGVTNTPNWNDILNQNNSRRWFSWTCQLYLGVSKPCVVGQPLVTVDPRCFMQLLGKPRMKSVTELFLGSSCGEGFFKHCFDRPKSPWCQLLKLQKLPTTVVFLVCFHMFSLLLAGMAYKSSHFFLSVATKAMSACPSSEWCQVLSLLAAWWQFRQPDVTGRGLFTVTPCRTRRRFWASWIWLTSILRTSCTSQQWKQARLVTWSFGISTFCNERGLEQPSFLYHVFPASCAILPLHSKITDLWDVPFVSPVSEFGIKIINNLRSHCCS